MYRPPSEGGSYSLLIRGTRNCPWNRCTFCGMYKNEKFTLREPAEVNRDIDSIAAICEELTATSHQLGFGGAIGRETVLEFIGREPFLGESHGFILVVNWLLSGGKTAFIQDGNSLQQNTAKVVDILKHLRNTFPSLERVTTYARSKTLHSKAQEELTAIRDAGLDRLHVGLETGDDQLLKRIKKGATSAEHIEAGRKAMTAGFQLSEYWMPGLGGTERWKEHALNTARVVNEINPHYIRSRPFYISPNTPIAEEYDRGNMELLSDIEQLDELRLMIENLDFDARVCFDHAGNHWRNREGSTLFSLSYEGYKFPEEKHKVLDLIEEGTMALRR
jgi:radical SAM superfamily enzyme YgiQ (UPF0313 family)